MNSKEHFKQLSIESALHASSCHERGEFDDAKVHEREAVLYELKSQATHRCGVDLYQVVNEPFGIPGSVIGVPRKLDVYLLEYVRDFGCDAKLIKIEG